MLIVITVCAVLSVISLWVFLSSILSTLARIDYKLKTIQEGLESTAISVGHIEDNIRSDID